MLLAVCCGLFRVVCFVVGFVFGVRCLWFVARCLLWFIGVCSYVPPLFVCVLLCVLFVVVVDRFVLLVVVVRCVLLVVCLWCVLSV